MWGCDQRNPKPRQEIRRVGCGHSHRPKRHRTAGANHRGPLGSPRRRRSPRRGSCARRDPRGHRRPQRRRPGAHARRRAAVRACVDHARRGPGRADLRRRRPCHRPTQHPRPRGAERHPRRSHRRRPPRRCSRPARRPRKPGQPRPPAPGRGPPRSRLRDYLPQGPGPHPRCRPDVRHRRPHSRGRIRRPIARRGAVQDPEPVPGGPGQLLTVVHQPREFLEGLLRPGPVPSGPRHQPNTARLSRSSV